MPFFLASLAASAVSAVSGGVMNNGAVQSAKGAAEAAAQNDNALTTGNYNRASGLEQPYVATGVNANNQVNALLGLPSTGATPQNIQAQANPDYSAYVRNNPDLMAQFQAQNGYARGRTMEQYGQLMWTQFDNSGRTYTPFGAATSGWDPGKGQQSLDSAQQAQQAQAGAPSATGAAQSAFQQYLDSTGHQFRLDTGTNALQTSAAAKGLLKSGATLKGLAAYGQNLGTQDFQTYLGNVTGQQSLGPSASGTLVNVGTNTTGQQTQTNDNLASIQGNAALSGAANSNQLLGSLTNALAYASGKSSYGGSGGSGVGADAIKSFAKYGNQTD